MEMVSTSSSSSRAANFSESDSDEYLAPRSCLAAEPRAGFEAPRLLPLPPEDLTLVYMFETRASSSFRFRSRFSALRGWLTRRDVPGSIFCLFKLFLQT